MEPLGIEKGKIHLQLNRIEELLNELEGVKSSITYLLLLRQVMRATPPPLVIASRRRSNLFLNLPCVAG